MYCFYLFIFWQGQSAAVRSAEWWWNFKLKSKVLFDTSLVFNLVLVDKNSHAENLQAQKIIWYGFNTTSSTTLSMFSAMKTPHIEWYSAFFTIKTMISWICLFSTSERRNKIELMTHLVVLMAALSWECVFFLFNLTHNANKAEVQHVMFRNIPNKHQPWVPVEKHWVAWKVSRKQLHAKHHRAFSEAEWVLFFLRLQDVQEGHKFVPVKSVFCLQQCSGSEAAAS